jgi:hypothetical protein
MSKNAPNTDKVLFVWKNITNGRWGNLKPYHLISELVTRVRQKVSYEDDDDNNNNNNLTIDTNLQHVYNRVQ